MFRFDFPDLNRFAKGFDLMTDPIQLSSAAAKWLYDRGWSELRRWDADLSIRRLKERGFTVHSMAELVLQRFGRMILNSCGLMLPRIVVEPDEAFHVLTPRNLELLPLAEEIRSPLCPVGCGSGWIMLSGADGKIVLLHEQWDLCSVCPNLSTLFDNSIFGGTNNGIELTSLQDYIVDW